MAHRSPATSQTLGARLTEHRALIFDVYGTLIDWESAIHETFVHVFPDLTREEILVRYAGVEGSLQTQFPNTRYSKLLELAYRQLATPSGMAMAGTAECEGPMKEDVAAPKSQAEDARRFGGSIPGWKPFPDTVDALHRLKKHFALIVLSNVDDGSFAGTHKKLCTPDCPGSAYSTITPDSPFSLVLTAQQVGAYKPSPVMLESALRQLSAAPDPSLPSNPSVRVDASRVLVVANSIRHDIIPAARHGLRSVWISRHEVNSIGNEGNDRSQEGRHTYSWRYETLGGMADAVEGEAPSYQEGHAIRKSATD